MLRFFERISSEIKQERHSQFGKRLTPNTESLTTVFKKHCLPVVVTNRNDLSIIVDIKKLVARRQWLFATEVFRHVVAVNTISVRTTVELDTFGEFFFDGGIATDGRECW